MVGLAPALLVIGGWAHRWMSDDGFINLRVVDQLFAGNGPVFNAGQRVEAGTSPLWIAMLAIGRAVAGWWVDMGWVAVALGIVLSALGLVWAQLGTARLWASPAHRLIPAGALVFAVVPDSWDYVTSGLETGLWFAWLGGSWWLLTWWADGDGAPRRGRRWALVVLGLGPLVRPELALYSAAFLVAWLLLHRSRWRTGLGDLATALLAPVAYQVFRMGYYGALVPNTAIAKEAGHASWSQGWVYLADFVQPLALIVPLAILGILVAAAWRPHRFLRGAAIMTSALVVPAVVQLVFIVRIGGDFMHARLLLAPLFALLVPVALIPVEVRRPVGLGALAVLGLWMFASVTTLGVPYLGLGPDAISDERTFWIGETGTANPVSVADYQSAYVARRGRQLAARHASGEQVVLRYGETELGVSRSGVVDAESSIGILALLAGTDVWVVDIVGLADPVAAHIELPADGGRPGHSKHLDDPWILAEAGRVDPTGANLEVDPGAGPAAGSAARALACGQARDLISATSDPLTPGRFLANIGSSLRLTFVRLPRDPHEAADRFCP